MRLLIFALGLLVAAALFALDAGIAIGRKRGYTQCLLEQDAPRTARSRAREAIRAR